MHLKKHLLLALPVTVLAVCLAQSAPAALILDSQFNDAGDSEGWTVGNASGVTADGDSLNYTGTNGDAQLLFGVANGPAVLSPAAGAQITTVVVRYRRTDTTTGVATAHDNAGTIMQLFRPSPAVNNVVNISGSSITNVADTDGFFILTADFSPGGSDYPWDVEGVGRLRIDVAGGPDSIGDLIEIDYVQFFDDSPIPEPSSIALLGLGGLLIARRRRD